MLTSQEEIFGPLLGLHRFETEEEAVRMANDTSMGLAAYFFTKDTSRTWRLLESLEAGMVGMNTGKAAMILPLIRVLLTIQQETRLRLSRLSGVSRLPDMERRRAKMSR